MGYQRQVTEDTYEYLLLNGEESFNDLMRVRVVIFARVGVDIPLTSLILLVNYKDVYNAYTGFTSCL